MNKIFETYLRSTTEVTDWFAHARLPNWQQVAKQVAQSRNNRLISVLIQQNQSVPFPAQKQNLALLQNPNTLVVVTGQQLGFLASPLYIVFKALTTVALCQQLNRRVAGFQFVPVFWLEGDDHDFVEVNKAFVFDRQHELQKLELNLPEAGRKPVRLLHFPDSVTEELQTLKQVLQETEFSAALFKQLLQIYRPGENWLKGFKEFLQTLVGPFGVLFFNPGSQTVKASSKPFFEQLLVKNDRLLQALQEQSVKFAKPQVTVNPERSYLFLLTEANERQPLLRRGQQRFQVFGDSRLWSLNELQNLLQQAPWRFSCSVLTRPLWQSWMLPVVSYVAGPAEIAYWAQLKMAFQQLNLPMPHLQPRFSATLLEPKIVRLLSKFNLQPAAIPQEPGGWIQDFFRQNHLQELQENHETLQNHLQKAQHNYLELVSKFDPTLAGTVNKTFANLQKQMEQLNKRLIRTYRQKNEQLTEQLLVLHRFLWPLGKPQERVLSPVYFQNKFGNQWLQKVAKAINIEQPEHQFLEV